MREPGSNGRFLKGHRRVPGSRRRKGQRPHVLFDVKAACEAIVDDPAYRENLRTRAIRGELSPAMETLLWQRMAPGESRPAGRVRGQSARLNAFRVGRCDSCRLDRALRRVGHARVRCDA